MLATRLAGSALLGAAALHAVAARDHRGLALPVAFFAALAVLQVAAGTSLLVRGARRPLALLLLAAAPVGLWAVSRTTGLPPWTGHGGVEPLGVADGTAAALELAALALGLGTPRPVWARAGRLALGGALAVSVAAVLVRTPEPVPIADVRPASARAPGHEPGHAHDPDHHDDGHGHDKR